MPNVVTMTVYLGSGEEGVLLEHKVEMCAARREMKKSQYAQFAIKEQVKRDIEEFQRSSKKGA